MPSSNKSTPTLLSHIAGKSMNGPGFVAGLSGVEIDSRALLSGSSRIAIRHGDCIYWLRATRQGKLLLTK